jgi:hypothetical protein
LSQRDKCSNAPKNIFSKNYILFITLLQIFDFKENGVKFLDRKIILQLGRL